MRWFLVTLFAAVPAFAYEPAPPQAHDVSSPNGLYFIHVDPYADVQTVYATADTSTPLWSFEQLSGLDTMLLADDGATAFWLSWRYTTLKSRKSPGLVIHKQDGSSATYSEGSLSIPRRYHHREIGPLGRSGASGSNVHASWTAASSSLHRDGVHCLSMRTRLR